MTPTPTHASRATMALPVLTPRAAPASPRRAWSRVRPYFLRLYRLAVVLAIVWVVQRQYARLRVDGDAPIKVEEVRPLLPGASKLVVDESDRLGLFVFDAKGARIGYILRTAPLTDKITGYCGPTDTLVVLDRDMRVTGIKIRSSGDTIEHVHDVENDDYFMKTWNGKTWDQIAGMDPQAAGIEGVSGASLTSMAIANGIHSRFKHSLDAPAKPPAIRFGANDIGLVIVIVLAVVFSFTHLRGHPWLRRTFQVVLIGYVGFWNGQILAQSLFSGWAASSVPWRLAPGLVLLAAAALVLPWTTRRAVYCSHICPHGVAQEWAGRISRCRVKVPRGVDAGLRWLPPMLIGLVLTVTILHLPFNLAGIEPFDAYLIRAAGIATIVIAIAGVIAAAFVPMAYCKYGCPTGALLSFVRSHGKADIFGRRDIAAGLLVALTILLYWRYDVLHAWILR